MRSARHGPNSQVLFFTWYDIRSWFTISQTRIRTYSTGPSQSQSLDASTLQYLNHYIVSSSQPATRPLSICLHRLEQWRTSADNMCMTHHSGGSNGISPAGNDTDRFKRFRRWALLCQWSVPPHPNTLTVEVDVLPLFQVFLKDVFFFFFLAKSHKCFSDPSRCILIWTHP